MLLGAVYGITEHIYGRHTHQIIGRGSEHSPPHEGCCVILFHIPEEALRSHVPSLCIDTSLHLQSNFMFGECVIEPPPALWVELILLHTQDTEVSLAQASKQVCSYFARIRRLSAFLSCHVHFIVF